MTAIDKFIRLEALGYWFEAGRQEGREVIVSFGDETLQLASLKDQPLTHWSLLATRRIGTRGEAVIYSADPEQHEILEIEDQDMIRAISAVTSALAPAPSPRAGRWLWRGALLAAVVAVLSFSPALITKTAATLTPPARIISLSEQAQSGLRADFGQECLGWQGQRALAAFSAKLFPGQSVDFLVFSAQASPMLTLPDGATSFSRAVVEAAETPQALASLAALSWAMAENRRPLTRYIAGLGAFGGLRYLLSGTSPKPEAAPAPLVPTGQDFITARDYLSAQGLSVTELQKLAGEYGIGLPVAPVAAAVAPFSFDDFETLQNICAE